MIQTTYRPLRWPLLLLISFVALSGKALAREEIIDFHADITVTESGRLEVIETYTVTAEQQQIKHGIYRDFPTRYPHHRYGKYKLYEAVGFELISAKRNGEAIKVRQKALENGVRLYLGDTKTPLPSGDYHYRLSYHTDRQLRREQADGTPIDVLRWNVVGQDWSLPFQKASVSINFPTDILEDSIRGWTGSRGAQASDFKAELTSHQQLNAETKQALSSQHGFTIELAAPAFVSTASDANFLTDNWRWLAALLSLLILPIYYFKAWIDVGRDPQKGLVVPRYHPIEGLTPAAHRFVVRQRYDHKTFAAAVLGLAVKGWLKIETLGKASYRLSQLEPSAKSTRRDLGRNMSNSEQRLYQALFNSQTSVELGKHYQASVAAAQKQHKAALVQEWGSKIYRQNQGFTRIGIAISAAALLLLGWHLSNGAISLLGPYLAASIGLAVLLGLISTARGKLRLIIVPFIGYIVLSDLLRGVPASDSMGLMFWVALIVSGLYLLFSHLLRAPTVFGQKLLDDIEGFRSYLMSTEKARLEQVTPPDKTPELFEALLPYAMALDVETAWSEQFSEVFNRAPLQEHHKHFYPVWYHPSEHPAVFDSRSITQALGVGLATSVAAAATAPASGGSGGGGGGSGSGGGGGGGGGF